jgi:hypothetical protein
MNERIQELLIEAHKQTNGGIYNGHLSEWTEKFTELIVQECASIFEGVYTDQQRPERIDTRIKSHFGVE